MREWPGAFRASWHLFGHVHGGYEGAPWGYSMDVGVDANAYRPISFAEVAETMAERDNPFVGERRLVRPTLWT
jgi:calcineurin-like phosphoesterase family protein